MDVLKGLKNWLILIAAVWFLDFTMTDRVDPYIFSIIMYAGINCILAVSLNLVNGFTGQFSMGHAGFMSVGAYVAALTTMYFQPGLGGWESSALVQSLLLIFALFLGGSAAALVGYCVGLPSLRLKGDYLAIVTLGFGEIIRVILLNINAVGGARGLPSIPQYTRLGWVYSILVFTVFIVWRLVNSNQGRALLAVREDEIAAESMGVNTTQAKVKAFVVGAFFAGVAGGLFGHYLMYLNPANFDFNKSFEIIIMVVLGGMGSISGSIVAALFLTGIREALRPLQQLTGTDYRMIIYALMLIVLMLTKPNGLFGNREFPEVFKRWRNKNSANKKKSNTAARSEGARA